MFRCSGAGRDKTIARANVRQEVPSWQCHFFISLGKTNWNSALTLTWQDRPPRNCVWRAKQQNEDIFHAWQDISGGRHLYDNCVRAWASKPWPNQPPPPLEPFPLPLAECLPPLHLHPVWRLVLLDVSPWHACDHQAERMSQNWSRKQLPWKNPWDTQIAPRPLPALTKMLHELERQRIFKRAMEGFLQVRFR